MKIAAVHSTSFPLHLEENLTSMRSVLAELLLKGVELAVFPELNVSGYLNSLSQLEEFQRQYEHVMQGLKVLSLDYEVAFTCGLPILTPEGFVIAQFLFNKGEIIGEHHKTHLGGTEKSCYVSGNQMEVFACPYKVGGRFSLGMQLCLESHFPELSALQEKKGAQLLTISYASPRETPREKLKRLTMMLQARAYDNSCFVVACNQAGKHPSGRSYSGVALILSPRGEVLASSCGLEQCYCLADVDLSTLDRIRHSKMGYFQGAKDWEKIGRWYK